MERRFAAIGGRSLPDHRHFSGQERIPMKQFTGCLNRIALFIQGKRRYPMQPMQPIRFLVLAAGVLVLAPRSLQADVPG